MCQVVRAGLRGGAGRGGNGVERLNIDVDSCPLDYITMQRGCSVDGRGVRETNQRHYL